MVIRRLLSTEHRQQRPYGSGADDHRHSETDFWHLTSVQLSEKANALVLNGLPSRSTLPRLSGRLNAIAGQSCAKRRHQHRAYAVAPPRYLLGMGILGRVALCS